MKKRTRKEAKKVWNELFSPPCPKCGSTRAKEELRDIPVCGTMKDILDRIIQRNKGNIPLPIRTWTCLDCETVFDEEGGQITYDS